MNMYFAYYRSLGRSYKLSFILKIVILRRSVYALRIGISRLFMCFVWLLIPLMEWNDTISSIIILYA